jgi:hypothetical protein
MPVVMVGSALGVFAYVTGSAVLFEVPVLPAHPGLGELLIFCSAMAGAGLAFLWFNTHPAQVFMGDVGALALGGALGTIAVIVRQEVVLAIMGGIFVVEAISVMAQVTYFKYTKRKYGEGRRIPQDGAAAPPLRKERLDRNAGRRALLDHHHAAVPARPVHAEAEVTSGTPQRPARSHPRPGPLGPGDGTLVRALRCASDLLPIRARRRRSCRPCASRCRRREFVAGAFDAALLETRVRPCSAARALARASRAVCQRREPGWRWRRAESVRHALADLQTPAGYAPAVLAVTGTNGKTTVTAWTGQLVERSGKDRGGGRQHRPHAAGHAGAEDGRIGACRRSGSSSLSSFQLDAAGDFEPTAAAVLNVTQDHLDWHGSMEAYAAAKARVFGKSTAMILNREDPLVMKMLPEPVRVKGGKFEQRPYVHLRRRHAPATRRLRIEVVNAWRGWSARSKPTRLSKSARTMTRNSISSG